MSAEASPAPYPVATGYGDEAPMVAPPRLAHVVLRLVVLAGLLLGWAQAATQPAERTLSDLYTALADGRVHNVVLERWPDEWDGSGQLRVEWTGYGRPAYAQYAFSRDDYGVDVDEGAEILQAAEASPVPVTVTEYHDMDVTGPTWQVGGLAAFAAFLLLLGGPQPRLATKWAWFWLSVSVPGAAVAFLVLEPVPVGVRQPLFAARRRMTGGWAFVIAALAGTVVDGTLRSLGW